MRNVLGRLIIVGLLALTASSAAAETGDEWLRRQVLLTIAPGVTWKVARAQLMMKFDISDPDHEGVSRKSLDKAARLYNTSLDNLVPLDLAANGEGIVTREAYEAAVRKVYVQLRPDPDAPITAAEAAAASQAFEQADMTRRQEEEAARRAAAEAALAAKCGLVPTAPESEVVLVGAYRGAGMSTAAIGDETVEVSVADVVVEAGDKPIRLLLSSFVPTIWRLSGHVERLEAVEASAESGRLADSDRVGMIGVAKDKVSFASDKACARVLWQRTEQNPLLRVPLVFGRAPKISWAGSPASRISVPSGAVEKPGALDGAEPLPSEGPAALEWQVMLKDNPGGLIAIDPTQVVAPAPVAAYAVLPQAAGLAKLVEEGALQPVYGADFRSKAADIAGNQGQHRPNGFLILRKIRFPAGLYGGYAVDFALMPGVPLPDGDHGHGKLLSFDTAEPVKGGTIP